jgi:hypothetical protein
MSSWRGSRRYAATGAIADPFAVNPVRRSLALVGVCAMIIFVPWLISDDALTTVMVSVGWLAVTGLVMGIPILIWSLVEAGVIELQSRRYPPVDQLDVSPRVLHILQRHGYQTIASVEAASDATLLLLSNMDTRGLREVRRAVAVWQYQRWQERGFPAEGV